MKISDKISVIIRCKNEERWIGHSIQSVLDFFECPEIIIIDNKSTDDSMEVVKLFSNKMTNNCTIKNINIDNYSPGRSINKGVKECSNNIILILSAHCTLESINFKKIKESLDIKKYLAVWGKQIPIYFGKKVNPTRYIWSNFEEKDSINYYSQGEKRYFLHNALCFYNKDTLLKYPFDEDLIGKEDRYWAIDRISDGKEIFYDSELVCKHYFTNNGATWKDY